MQKLAHTDRLYFFQPQATKLGNFQKKKPINFLMLTLDNKTDKGMTKSSREREYAWVYVFVCERQMERYDDDDDDDDEDEDDDEEEDWGLTYSSEREKWASK